MNLSRLFYATALLLFVSNNAAAADAKFTFESVPSIEEMSSLMQSSLSLGTPRAHVRRIFVEEGRATLKAKTDEPGVEKYIYDIDLCHYYIWRWNISADYDTRNQLRQIYINGNPVFAGGNPKKAVSKVAEGGKKASILKLQRPRPEAYKGEKSLGFLLFDRDSSLATKDDQVIAGTGPSRADPLNMGRAIAYTDIDPWRSIFDSDAADRIAPYEGDCKETDRKMSVRTR